MGGKRTAGGSLNDMTDHELNFTAWVAFEANRIKEVGLLVPEPNRAGSMTVQIKAALWKAAHHFQDGLTASDARRAVRRPPTQVRD